MQVSGEKVCMSDAADLFRLLKRPQQLAVYSGSSCCPFLRRLLAPFKYEATRQDVRSAVSHHVLLLGGIQPTCRAIMRAGLPRVIAQQLSLPLHCAIS